MTVESLSPLLTGIPRGPQTPPRGRLHPVAASEPSLSETLSKLLRNGERVPDEGFDRLLDVGSRIASAVHWTPIDVCLRVTKLLAAQRGERVLDIGCGVGKLCIIGSIVSEAVFVGIEQRAHLVDEAKRAAQLLASPAQFIHADAFAVDWAEFHALYLYNPFDELRFDPDLRIDGTIEFDESLFHHLVRETRTRLAQLPDGTRVVTFHGFGGPMPDSYQLHSREPAAGGSLELWIQSERAARD